MEGLLSETVNHIFADMGIFMGPEPKECCHSKSSDVEGTAMLRSFNAPLTTTIASVGAIMTAALIGGVAVFLSGVLEVRAEPAAVVVAPQTHVKGDRLPVLFKGTACSSLGWPHYEQGCGGLQMRREPCGL
jgi:hypothetical protein